MSIVSLNIYADTDEEADLPSMELLQFLSEWETDEGLWYGPEQFADDSFDQLYEGADVVNDVTEDEYAEE